MVIKRVPLLAAILLISFTARAQVNIYLGGNLQGNYSWLRGDENTLEPGFGGGFSFVYWEKEYWFLKAGLEYSKVTSSSLEYPEDYDIPITDPDDKVNITFSEQAIGIPLTFYFRPYESRASTLLVTASLKTMMVFHLKEYEETLGELLLKGSDINSRTKTNVGIGVGYQHQLDRNIYLNIIPSFNLDIRAARSFNTINLTAELIFGVY